MIDSAEAAELYNKRLSALSQRADSAQRLDAPDVTARAVSPICGSVVDVDLKIENEKISAFGFAVEACALTKSVLAVLQTAAIGRTRDEIRAAGADLRRMLEDNGPAPDGDFSELAALMPARDFRARHNSILLPFEAVEKAFAKREGA